MEQAGKNRTVITPQGQAELNQAINTPVRGGVGRQGYQYGQASGPNGTRTLAEKQAELLSETRTANKPVAGINKTTGKWTGKSVVGNSRDTVVYNEKGATNIALRDAENSLANKGTVQERMRNLSPERQKQLQEMKLKRTQAATTTPKPSVPPVPTTPKTPYASPAVTPKPTVPTTPKPTAAARAGMGLGKAALIGTALVGAGALLGSSLKKKEDK